MGVLGTMINSEKINVKQFFTMHPFTATDRMYNIALQGIDFFNDIYIQTGKTYERLASICSVANNAGMNLVVVTGYRGCGKTNFLQLTKHIAEDRYSLKPLSTLYNQELQYAKDSDEQDRIRLSYNEAYENIRKILHLRYYAKSDNYIDQTFNEYVRSSLQGRCEHINFDTGGMSKKRPLSSKLLLRFREVAEKIVKDGRKDQVIDIINGFVSRNKWLIEDGFESIDYSSLKSMWRKVRTELPNISLEHLDDYLQAELRVLSLEQLLFSYTLMEYADIITLHEEYKYPKLLYLLDNIDMISDGSSNIFENTMMGIWKFIWDTRTVFEQIHAAQCEDDAKFLELYNKTNFIVAMRETTAMHISEHLRDRMRGIMEHFDMSSDVDKTMVMHRRIILANKMIAQHEIVNEGFIETITLLDKLIEDRVLLKNMFMLYNNDYRTSMAACTWIVIHHHDKIVRAIELMQTGKAKLVFGGRGIIYRLLFDAFSNWSYLDAIGVTTHGAMKPRVIKTQYGYSFARIILTILCNEQSKNTDRFFVDPEESVKLIDLYSMVRGIIDIDDFINIIDGMYSLRDKDYWNHLVTFDNILKYSPPTIKTYLTASSPNDKKQDDIYIRATSAGQVFAGLLCTHFEYFSSRFSSMNCSIPLFLTLNTEDSKCLTTIRQIIDDTYVAVANCCKNLEEYNKNVLLAMKKTHYTEVLGSPYYYEKQFHEERIIHNHISYLEAFRTYVLSSPLDTRISDEINTYVISMLKKYLTLLKYDPKSGLRTSRDLFFSHNSCVLYNELNVCIEHIERAEADAKTIEVTRSFYRQNYNGEKCSNLKEIEVQYGVHFEFD